MLTLKIADPGIHTVADVPEEFTLLTGSMDIILTLWDLGLPYEEISEFGCLFVQILDGEYGWIYGCHSLVPWAPVTPIAYGYHLTEQFEESIAYWRDHGQPAPVWVRDILESEGRECFVAEQ